jgi:GNAT superfamily N-acetyltransferase
LIIENFRGDFEQVASLIQLSWVENEKQPLLYTAEFLASFFEYPGASFSLSPTLYDRSKPVAFVVGFPRRLRFKDQELRIIVISFLSVSNEYKNKGYGIVLWSELVKRAQAEGFDGMMNYCVEGEPMNGMIIASCQRLKIPVERVHAIHYLSCYLWPKDSGNVENKLGDGNVRDFLELAAPILESTPLGRIWSQPEAEWQCSRRLGVIVARHGTAGRQGILTGYVMTIADPKRTKCLLVEDILWGNLGTEERSVLVRQLKSEAVSAGARLAVVPILGYADMKPFLSTGFRPSQRVVQAYLSIWNGQPEARMLDSMYLDVF